MSVTTKVPKPLRLDKWSEATAYEAGDFTVDGERIKHPREVTINAQCINLRQTKRLIKWLQGVEKWMRR